MLQATKQLYNLTPPHSDLCQAQAVITFLPARILRRQFVEDDRINFRSGHLSVG